MVKAIHVDLEALRNIPLKERMTIEDVCKTTHEKMEVAKVFFSKKSSA